MMAPDRPADWEWTSLPARRWGCVWLFAGLLGVAPLASSAEPPAAVRVAARAQPSAVAPGTVFELQVTIELPAGWIAYDVEQQPDSVPPTRIDLEPSDRFAPVDNFRGPIAYERPDPMVNHRLVRYFAESPTFRRGFLVAADAAPGAFAISGRIDFQVRCDETGRSYVVRKYPFRAEVTITALEPAMPVHSKQPAQGDAVRLLRPVALPVPAGNPPGAPVSVSVPVGTPPASAPSPAAPDPVTASGVGKLAEIPAGPSGKTEQTVRKSQAPLDALPVPARPSTAPSDLLSGQYDDLFRGEFGLDRYGWLVGGDWWLGIVGLLVGILAGGVELRRIAQRGRCVARLAGWTGAMVAAGFVFLVFGDALGYVPVSLVLWGSVAAIVVWSRRNLRLAARAGPSVLASPAFWLTAWLAVSTLATDFSGLPLAAGAAGVGLLLAAPLALADPSWSHELLPRWMHPERIRR